MRSARECIEQAVKIGLAPMFKKHGFKKNGLNFSRRIGSVGHFFNVQLSQWNRGEEGYFYCNAGVMFDEIFALHGQTPPALPKYFDCQFMVRLERLNTALPQSYSVDAKTDVMEFAQRISSVVEETYVLPLNDVSCAKDFEATGWAQAVPWDFPAVFAYILGNVNEARRLVRLQAERFADRGCTFESVAESLGLRFERE